MKRQLRDAYGRFTTRTLRWNWVLEVTALLFFPTIAIVNAYDANERPDVELPHAIEVAEAKEVKSIPFEDAFIVTYDWSEERITEEIRKAFPETPGLAVAIAKCESQYDKLGDLSIQSQHQLSYGQEESFGLFQIHLRDHAAKVEEMGLDVINNPYDNIEFARFLYERKGNRWTDWTCFNKGYYKKHL